VRFDVLVQRRTERLDNSGAELEPPGGQPRLSAAQAWSIARAHRQPQGRKPSVRLATFVDPDFGVPTGPGRRIPTPYCGNIDLAITWSKASARLASARIESSPLREDLVTVAGWLERTTR
jgi:hypothetical protein